MRDKKDIKIERAVRDNNVAELKALLSGGSNVNVRLCGFEGIQNNTLLHCAHNSKIVKELLLGGARVNETNINMETPLHVAITLRKDLELVRELLKHGAAVNAIDIKGNTALNYAVKMRLKIDIIKELLKHGSDINIKNQELKLFDNCYSPLDNAIIRCPKVSKLLIKYALIRNFEGDYRNIINFKDLVKCIANYFSSYLEECVCEVKQMETEIIENNVPCLYNIVKNNFNKDLLRNNLLSLQLSRIDFTVNYPIYYDIILDSIEPFLRRADLLENLKMIEIYNMNTNEKGTNIILDTRCINFVTEYLSNEDLLNLIYSSRLTN